MNLKTQENILLNKMKTQIKIEINKKEYLIPNSYDQLSISKFQNIVQIQNYQLTDNEKNRLIISIILDCDIETVNELKLEQVNDILECLTFIKSDITDVESKPFELNNEKYYPISNINELEFGAYIDLDVLLNEGMIDNIHKIISILYRRKKGLKLEKYDSKHSDEIADDIASNIGIGYVYSTLVFFCQVENKYMKDIQIYLDQMKKVLMMKK